MIHLIDDLYLDADESCFMLIVWDGKARTINGKEIPANAHFHYYGLLEPLFQGLHRVLARRAVRNSESIDQLLKLYSDIENTISDLLNRDDVIAGLVKRKAG